MDLGSQVSDIACHLTHWGRDKVAAISQTILSNSFSWIQMLEIQLNFHWKLFHMVQLKIFHHWFRWWLGASQATSHYLNQWWFLYWRIFASRGLNELTQLQMPTKWINPSNARPVFVQIQTGIRANEFIGLLCAGFPLLGRKIQQTLFCFVTICPLCPR